MIGEAFSSYFFHQSKVSAQAAQEHWAHRCFSCAWYSSPILIGSMDCVPLLWLVSKDKHLYLFSGAWRWLNLVALSYDWFVVFQVDIPVRIVGGETVLVTFTGVGYDQRIMGDTLPVRDMGSTTVPDKQVVQVPKQVCVSVTVFKALFLWQQ